VPNIPIDVTSDRGWKLLESKLPEDLEQLAREHKTLETQYGDAKLKSGRDLLRLIFLHAGADLALRQAVALMAESGGPSVSHVTLHKKMRLAGPLLRDLVARLADGGDVNPERWAGYEVIAVDASSFCGPGATTTEARVHLQLRLADLDILAAPIENASVGESFKRFDWRQGQLAVGDRGYGNAPGIAHVVSEGADVLVRINRSSLPMRTQQGEKLALMTWLRSLPGHGAHEKRVSVFSREHSQTVMGRVIAQRLPVAEAEKARARVRRELKGKTKPQDLEAAQYVVLFATVPASRLSSARCLQLYRLRWQVELAFKRWKSLCHFDRLPNYRDDTILSWLYAKLLLALLMHRMAQGRSPLFPPEEEEGADSSLACASVEGRQYSMAGARLRVAAA